MKSGVQKTRAGLVNALEDAIQGKKEIDADLLDELEGSLLAADIGVRTTEEILERIRQRVERHQLADAAELKNLIREQLLEILAASERAPRPRDGAAGRSPAGGRERLGQDHHHR
ncbi:MAG: signal recognition particle receptor subunit alpha [Ignavibacteriota bacterium]